MNVQRNANRAGAAAANAGRHTDEGRHAAPDAAPGRGPETILLVDDEPAVRTAVARILGRQGYTVLQASLPGEALSVSQGHAGDIALVVTDLMMPEMNGRELASRLLAARPRMRVLYTSGYADDSLVQRGLLDPGTPFLSKPFAIDLFARKVRELLDA